VKLIVKTKELKKALEQHKRVIHKLPTEILNGIKLKARNDKLELYNTDLEFNLKSTLNAIIDNPGEVLLPLKNLDSVVKNTETQEISLELVENKVKIGNISLNTLSLEEFPAWPEVNGEFIDIDYNHFIGVLGTLRDCISTDELKSVLLTGYCLNTAANEIVATDSYKLGQVKFNFSTNMGNLIMPYKVYDLLKKVKSEEGKLKLTVEENQLKLSIDNMELVCRLLTGTYPNYQQILDGLNSKYIIEFEPEDLIKHLKKIQKVLKPGEVPVQLTFEAGHLVISYEDKEVGSYSDEIMAVGTMKEPVSMSFNSVFLVQTLKQFEGRIKVELDDDRRPIVIKQPENENSIKFILMPVKS